MTGEQTVSADRRSAATAQTDGTSKTTDMRRSASQPRSSMCRRETGMTDTGTATGTGTADGRAVEARHETATAIAPIGTNSTTTATCSRHNRHCHFIHYRHPGTTFIPSIPTPIRTHDHYHRSHPRPLSPMPTNPQPPPTAFCALASPHNSHHHPSAYRQLPTSLLPHSLCLHHLRRLSRPLPRIAIHQSLTLCTLHHAAPLCGW